MLCYWGCQYCGNEYPQIDAGIPSLYCSARCAELDAPSEFDLVCRLLGVETKQYIKFAVNKGKRKNKTKQPSIVYRFKKLGATNNDIDFLLERQDGKCVVCEEDISDNRFHLDHIFPRSRGGIDDISNIQLLCPRCNLKKSNQTMEEFLYSIAVSSWVEAASYGL